MENDLVSILIPVYNREDIVSDSIESAINQTYKNIEIIIVDNCSTDKTWEVLTSYAKKDNRIKIFRNETNIGPVRNWARCIDLASGKYSKFLYSDDVIQENYVQETIRLFDDETAFVISRIIILDEQKTIEFDSFKRKTIFTTKEYFLSRILTNEYIFPFSPSSAIFRTSDLKDSLEIEIENPLMLDFTKYGAGNDLLIFLNIALKYDKVKVSKNTISYFRAHSGSFSISNDLSVYYNYTILYFTQKHFSELLSSLKSTLWFVSKKNKDCKVIYDMINENRNFLFFVKLFYFHIKNKIFYIKKNNNTQY